MPSKCCSSWPIAHTCIRLSILSTLASPFNFSATPASLSPTIPHLTNSCPPRLLIHCQYLVLGSFSLSLFPTGTRLLIRQLHHHQIPGPLPCSTLSGLPMCPDSSCTQFLYPPNAWGQFWSFLHYSGGFSLRTVRRREATSSTERKAVVPVTRKVQLCTAGHQELKAYRAEVSAPNRWNLFQEYPVRDGTNTL